jgi:uncharacterized protein YcbX
MSSGSGGVVAIYRYPVKGLSAEKMDRVVLTPGECLPHDLRPEAHPAAVAAAVTSIRSTPLVAQAEARRGG